MEKNFNNDLSIAKVLATKDYYEGIIFDLDQTLIDFENAEKVSLDLLYEAFFSKHCNKDNFLSMFHEINRDIWRKFEKGLVKVGEIGKRRFELISELLSTDLNIEEIASFYETSLGMKADWFPGAEETIIRLSDMFDLAVVTNGFSSVQSIKYKNLSLGKWFKSYIVSEDVGCFKPEKKIFQLALQKMNKEKHKILVVGDSLSSDYKGALAAGIDFCWVNIEGKELPEGMARPKYIVSSVTELIE